jgi:hypothetical protein
MEPDEGSYTSKTTQDADNQPIVECGAEKTGSMEQK